MAAARSIGSGTISFGLVTIPFKVFTAVSPDAVSFNMLHAACGSRVKQQLVCPAEDNKVVERDETVKGYLVGVDQFVKFTAEEIKALEADRTNQILISEFVPASTIDLLSIEKTYFIGPDNPISNRSYHLLVQCLRTKGAVAVGRYAVRGKDNLVVLSPFKSGLALHQCYYANEVRDFKDVPIGKDVEFQPMELGLANTLVEQLWKDDFDASRFRDEYVVRVRAAVDRKMAGEAIDAPAPAEKSNIVDLLEALKRSVEEVGERKLKEPKKASPRAKAPQSKSGNDAG